MGEAILDWLFERAMPWIIIAFIVFIVAGICIGIYAIYLKSQSQTFTLYKTEWVCTNMQRIPVTTYIKTGDVLVPVMSHQDVCHQWSRQP